MGLLLTLLMIDLRGFVNWVFHILIWKLESGVGT